MRFGSLDKRKGVVENSARLLTGDVRQLVAPLTMTGKREGQIGVVGERVDRWT